MNHERSEANAGFTLIEVIVAFLVLSMTLGSALLSISYSTRLYRKSDEMAAVRQLAERLIAEKFDAARGRQEKEAGNAEGMRWRVERVPIADEFTPAGNRLMQFQLSIMDRRGEVLDQYRSLYVER